MQTRIHTSFFRSVQLEAFTTKVKIIVRPAKELWCIPFRFSHVNNDKVISEKFRAISFDLCFCLRNFHNVIA